MKYSRELSDKDATASINSKNLPVDDLMTYLDSDSASIRRLAVKHIGRMTEHLLGRDVGILMDLARGDSDSLVRRETISTLGRLRDQYLIPYFRDFLFNTSEDPKVTLQVVRSLLVFKKSHPEIILPALRSLRGIHPNEQIQQVLARELDGLAEVSDYEGYPTAMKDTCVFADARDVLKLVPDGSIHLTFTSPPYYNARDYAVYNSYIAYLDFLEGVFCQLHRVTKEGRFLVVNTSPVIVPRVSRAYASKRYAIPFDLHNRLTGIGWEFIDDIVWVKPESSVKNRNGSFYQHRKPLGYKPNAVTEYLMVYRKRSDRLIDWNMRQYDSATVEESQVADDYQTSNVWRFKPSSDAVHTAIFPNALCAEVIKLYSYVNDLVFDPFAGSGTVGKVANELGRSFFLTEFVSEHFDRMKQIVPSGRFVGLEQLDKELKSDE